jgi:ATP-dependent exoDNAse (exonuclease V) alpha subunit
MSRGASDEAIEAISGHLIELRREETRARYITKEFAKMDQEGRSKTMILAGTNRERAVITEHIRDLLKRENSIVHPRDIFRLKAKDLSREEMTVASKFEAGDFVSFHREIRRSEIKKDDFFEVVAVREADQQLTLRDRNGRTIELPLSEHQGSFTAYEKAPLEIALGDSLKWTKNNRKLDVRNGEECVVSAIDDSKIWLRKSNGKMIEQNIKEPLHIDHNYVHTVFASQGKTCDRVFISVDKTFGQEAMYVALSRARFEAKVITPDKDQMLETISQSRAKLSALEVVPEQRLSQEFKDEFIQKNQRQKLS